MAGSRSLCRDSTIPSGSVVAGSALDSLICVLAAHAGLCVCPCRPRVALPVCLPFDGSYVSWSAVDVHLGCDYRVRHSFDALALRGTACA